MRFDRISSCRNLSISNDARTSNMICYRYVLWHLFLVVAVGNEGDHLSNSQFHCWPMTASAQRPDPYPKCPGVTAYWVSGGNVHMTGTKSWKLSYFFAVNSSFYGWAVGKGIFDHAGPGPGFRNATRAEAWCEGTRCPGSLLAADESNCCLRYVNLHFCPPDRFSPGAPCRPWLPAQGTVIAHSVARPGPVTTRLWTSVLRADGLKKHKGKIQLLAVFKLAGMLAALEATFSNLRTECGDGQCDGEEDCHSCDSDCGQCAVTLHTKWIIIIAVLCICGILLIITLVTLLFFRWKRNRALNDETWVVEPSQILAAASSMHLSEKLSVISWQSAQSKIKALSDPAMQEITREHAICSLSVAHVKGQKVLVKTYHNEEFQLTPRIRKEVMTVRHLVHPNLCPFIGGTVQPGNIFILYEYCSKGSLIDLLSNEDLPLNWIFRFSMLADVSRGMAFLHRHNLVHGNLKSSNCVVDDRWVCKVTDYGLQEYRRESFTCSDEEELRIRHEEKVRRDRVYRAPEADTDLQPASDVFSFAVIMLEVATRERVKPQGGQSHEELKRSGRRFSLHIDMHSDSTTFEPHRTSSFRSSQSRVTTASRYQELIVKCWADKPGDRPDFLTIEKVLLLMTPSKKNPVDTMMGLMQMYSKNLQQLVEKRSQQLLEEKQKTESLLYNILPRPVADKLRNGQPVRAESYEASTVFFSDIVGFNTMSARSSPMQIVVLLNKLYTNFDSVIERYNVYKVETIGDAYMVVSGVPNRNTQHAYDVAMMALDMMTTTKNFVIPHLPTEPLFIRAGLHSGPVCAGVVGIKMPRYCLFGDTVNTASRMESNARASSIHISNATYEALEPTNKFQFECRGHILIKGKGKMLTWWLLGIKAEEEAFLSSGTKESYLDLGILTNAYSSLSLERPRNTDL